MQRWLPVVVKRIRRLARERKVLVTHKALRELAALDLGLDVDDACDVLAKLTQSDFAGRLVSQVTKEWLYIFRPGVAGITVYLKLVLRRSCVVVSFHEEEVEDGKKD